MFDKWKTKRALCKAFDFYRQKKEMYLRIYTLNIYEQFEEIEYAIAYVLCEYFDLKCDNPWSYKWYITYDYTHYYSKCKVAYEKIIEQKNKENMKYRYNYIAQNTKDLLKHDYAKGDIIYNVENGCVYLYNGRSFKNIS